MKHLAKIKAKFLSVSLLISLTICYNANRIAKYFLKAFFIQKMHVNLQILWQP